MSYTYSYPRPAVAVDGVLIGLTPDQIPHLLLVERLNDPFQGQWALPGGFVDQDEDPDRSIVREFEEETNCPPLKWTLFGTYGKPGRDPRGHVVTLAYFSLVNQKQLQLEAGDDAKTLHWFPVNQLPSLAFDHDLIIQDALAFIQSRMQIQLPKLQLFAEPISVPIFQRLYTSLIPGVDKMDAYQFRKLLETTELPVSPTKNQPS